MLKLKYRNLTFSFDGGYSGNVMKTIEKGNFYEQRMLQYIENLDLKHSTIVDIGANIGNHSIYLATFIESVEVLAIEPHPKNYSVLVKNIKNNKLENKIKPYNLAIGDKAGRCSIQDGPLGNLASSKVVEGEEIEVKTLDELLNNKYISLIKIDVEGYEVNVLRGATKILQQQSPFLFIEAQTLKAKKLLDNILYPLAYRPIKVFNSTDTYLYIKNPHYDSFFHMLSSNLYLSLQRLGRVIRRTPYFRWAGERLSKIKRGLPKS